MSNKTQLQTNNTALDALITRVNAAKDTAASLPESGGGSSGGSVETCTVTLDNESLSCDCTIFTIMATVVENGVERPYFFENSAGEWIYAHTISNVKCGSRIYLITHLNMTTPYVEIDGGATYDFGVTDMFGSLSSMNFCTLAFTAPTTADEHCTIYYAYDA